MLMDDNLRGLRVFRKDEESSVKLADIDLGDNPQMWFAKIYGAFEAQHPDIYDNTDSVPSLTFTKKDFVAGSGLGAMSVSAGRNMLVFPVIIRESKLAPFDLVYINGNLQYADQNLVASMTNPYSPFKGVSSRESTNGPPIFNETITSKGHNSAYSRSRKFASQDGQIDVMEDLKQCAYGDVETPYLGKSANKLSLNDIGHTITDEQLSKLAEVLKNHPADYVHSTQEFKEYVNSLKDYLHKDASPQSWSDTVLISKRDINEYRIRKGRVGYDGYVEEKSDANGVRKLAQYFGQDPQAVLDKTDAMARVGGAVVISSLDDTVQRIKTAVESMGRLAKSGIGPEDAPTFKHPGEIGRYGPYNVLLDDGMYDTGTVYPMVDWNFNKSGNLLYVGSKYAMQSRMAGQPASSPCVAPRGEPREGAVGTYVYEKPNAAFALPPFKITSHRHTESGIAINGRSLIDEKLLNIVPTDDVNSLVKMTRENDPGSYVENAVNVYVPSKMDFIILPPERGLVIEDPQNAVKMAAFFHSPQWRGAHQIKVRNVGDGYYDMDMTGFPLNIMPPKVASLDSFRKLDRRADSLPEIYFNLKIAGVTSPDILTNTPEGSWDSVYVQTPPADKHFGKEAGMRRNAMAWQRVQGLIPRDGLFKIAAEAESSSTLDELFALNFMNEDNVEYFMSNLDALDEMNAFLSRLLLGSRVAGIHNLSEDEIKDTLDGVVEIKKALSSFARGVS